MHIRLHNNVSGMHRTGKLPARLDVPDITNVVGFSPNWNPNDGKGDYFWCFDLDGERCGIWDYYDTRWSIYDPSGNLQELFNHAL